MVRIFVTLFFGSELMNASCGLTLDEIGDELLYKMKKSTPMRKLFDAYAVHRGLKVIALRFKLDLFLLRNDDTPQSLSLEQHDVICVTMKSEADIEQEIANMSLIVIVRGNMHRNNFCWRN